MVEGSGSPDLDSLLLDGSGSYPTAAEAGAAAAAAALGVGGQQQRQHPQGKQQQAQQDALAAATNLPGSQDLAPGAEAAAVAALPPQLAGYYRWPGASLLGCLNRFTHAEQLGRGERWTCERCCSGQHAVKQLSLRHLPPLLVFHAKRFEHAGEPPAAAWPASAVRSGGSCMLVVDVGLLVWQVVPRPASCKHMHPIPCSLQAACAR